MESFYGRPGCAPSPAAPPRSPPQRARVLRPWASSVTAARHVEKLRLDHPIEGFDCGREELNRYLLRYAWVNQQAGAAQSYIGLVGDTVVGYYTLAVGQVAREQAPERLTKGLARHPVPIMLLARLAVAK